MPVLPLQFIEVNDYTTYRAEFVITEGDIVFHFFPTDEVYALTTNPTQVEYWQERFGVVLDKTAQAYFQTDASRLKAAYTEEQVSWWLRALGFGLVLDPHKFVYAFLDVLDRAAEGAMTNAA